MFWYILWVIFILTSGNVSVGVGGKLQSSSKRQLTDESTAPTFEPTQAPTTMSPTQSPTTSSPTVSPTTRSPTLAPSAIPTSALGAATTYPYFGSYYTVVVPSAAASMTATVYGAGGNTATGDSGSCHGGYGASVTMTFSVSPGSTYYVYVGGLGTATSGGFNGGGSAPIGGTGLGGNGATDIRTTIGDLSSRIIVAGAGGGCDPTYNDQVNGGNGGLNGFQGDSTYNRMGGYGGTQTGGGAVGASNGSPGVGTLGVGGKTSNYGGAGGGGYYGGGGAYIGGGGGGSSYPPSAQIVNGTWTGAGQAIITFGAAPTLAPTQAPTTRAPTTKPSLAPTKSPTFQPTGYGSTTFAYSGSYATVVVPPDASSMTIEAYGAGDKGCGCTCYAATVTATYAVTAGQTYFVFVGGTGTATSGGFNGGGKSYGQSTSCGGNGATDVRTDVNDLSSRIIVAGGAGGCSKFPNLANGGSGGYNGADGNSYSGQTVGAGGGTHSAGGAVGTLIGGDAGDAKAGSLGLGGDAASGSSGGGGGGGGYYGGGGGNGGAGGGGSSFGQSGAVYTNGTWSSAAKCVVSFNVPTAAPSVVPTLVPTVAPTTKPTVTPSILPTLVPTNSPTIKPTTTPTIVPTLKPTILPTMAPTKSPTVMPSTQPTAAPTTLPTAPPTIAPTRLPTVSIKPTVQPSIVPTVTPTVSCKPSATPTTKPTPVPSFSPTYLPTSPASTTFTFSGFPQEVVVPVGATAMSVTVAGAGGGNLTTGSMTCRGGFGATVTATFAVSPGTSYFVYVGGQGGVSSRVNNGGYNGGGLAGTYTAKSRGGNGATDVRTAQGDLSSRIIVAGGGGGCSNSNSVPNNGGNGGLTGRKGDGTHGTVSVGGGGGTQSAGGATGYDSDSAGTGSLGQGGNSHNYGGGGGGGYYGGGGTFVCGGGGGSSYPPTAAITNGTWEGNGQAIISFNVPTALPTSRPSSQPSRQPSSQPSQPSGQPSVQPSNRPSDRPSNQPSNQPSMRPTTRPTNLPSGQPSNGPSAEPTGLPSTLPTLQPSNLPSGHPSCVPTSRPSALPSKVPSSSPSTRPSRTPSSRPTNQPSDQPSSQPSRQPSRQPLARPSRQPSQQPSRQPTSQPSGHSVKGRVASLPSDKAITVYMPAQWTFKIVLPLSALTSLDNATACSDVRDPSSRFATGLAVSSNRTLPAVVAVGHALVSAYSSVLAFDTTSRAVGVLPDVNGDGWPDLIIGEPQASRCYVLYGRQQGLIDMSTGFTIFGESEGDLAGWSVSGTGDVNNDTLHDIVIGAPNARGVGAAYVIYGRRRGFDVYLGNLSSADGFAVYGATQSDFLGISVSGAGDVNGDGFDDVMVGAVRTAAYFTGAAYVLYGGGSPSSLGSVSLLTDSRGFIINGAASYQYAGCSVSSAGDINLDGLADVIIGTSPAKSGLALTAYVVYGRRTASDVSLSALTVLQGFTIAGAGAIVASGTTLSGVSYALATSSWDSAGSSGLVVFTNTSHLVPQTAQPVLLPTTKPSLLPTITPTVKQTTLRPSARPTAVPSLRPTAPTRQPIVGGTNEPTVSPTLVPSQEPVIPPTEAPTVRPTRDPTCGPTVAPTRQPSEGPTHEPSLRPTAVPSTAQPSVAGRQPFGIPTLLPTVRPPQTEMTTVVVDRNGTLDDSSSPLPRLYIVNGTGAVAIDPSQGRCVFRVIPGTRMVLSIERFNVSSDRLDVTQFTYLHKYADLRIQGSRRLTDTGGETVTTLILSTLQSVRIKNQAPGAFSESNFMFAPVVANVDKLSASVLLSVMIVVPAVVGIIALWYVWQWVQWTRRKKPVVPNTFILTFETDKHGDPVFYAVGDDTEESSVNLSDFTVASLAGESSSGGSVMEFEGLSVESSNEAVPQTGGTLGVLWHAEDVWREERPL